MKPAKQNNIISKLCYLLFAQKSDYT